MTRRGMDGAQVHPVSNSVGVLAEEYCTQEYEWQPPPSYGFYDAGRVCTHPVSLLSVSLSHGALPSEDEIGRAGERERAGRGKTTAKAREGEVRNSERTVMGYGGGQ